MRIIEDEKERNKYSELEKSEWKTYSPWLILIAFLLIAYAIFRAIDITILASIFFFFCLIISVFILRRLYFSIHAFKCTECGSIIKLSINIKDSIYLYASGLFLFFPKTILLYCPKCKKETVVKVLRKDKQD